jgi:hypothetical protein
LRWLHLHEAWPFLLFDPSLPATYPTLPHSSARFGGAYKWKLGIQSSCRLFLSVVAYCAFFSSDAGQSTPVHRRLLSAPKMRMDDIISSCGSVFLLSIINGINGATTLPLKQHSLCSKRNSFTFPQALSRLKRVALKSLGKVRQARWRNAGGFWGVRCEKATTTPSN